MGKVVHKRKILSSLLLAWLVLGLSCYASLSLERPGKISAINEGPVLSAKEIQHSLDIFIVATPDEYYAGELLKDSHGNTRNHYQPFSAHGHPHPHITVHAFEHYLNKLLETLPSEPFSYAPPALTFVVKAITQNPHDGDSIEPYAYWISLTLQASGAYPHNPHNTLPALPLWQMMHQTLPETEIGSEDDEDRIKLLVIDYSGDKYMIREGHQRVFHFIDHALRYPRLARTGFPLNSVIRYYFLENEEEPLNPNTPLYLVTEAAGLRILFMVTPQPMPDEMHAQYPDISTHLFAKSKAPDKYTPSPPLAAFIAYLEQDASTETLPPTDGLAYLLLQEDTVPEAPQEGIKSYEVDKVETLENALTSLDLHKKASKKPSADKGLKSKKQPKPKKRLGKMRPKAKPVQT